MGNKTGDPNNVQWSDPRGQDPGAGLDMAGLQLANPGGNTFTGVFIDPKYKGGKPYEELDKWRTKGVDSVGIMQKDAREVSQQFRDLKFRHKGMRGPDGKLVQSESFGVGKQQAETKRDKDIAAAQAAGKGATSRAMATQSMFGSSGGGARSRSEAQQAGVTQEGQQATRAATAQQIGQMSAADLQQQALREQSLEDQMMQGAATQQQSFGLLSDAQRSAADSYRPEVDWERNAVATNTTQMNQMELAKLGMSAQMNAAQSQAAATMFSGLASAGSSAMKMNFQNPNALPAGTTMAPATPNYSPYTA